MKRILKHIVIIAMWIIAIYGVVQSLSDTNDVRWKDNIRNPSNQPYVLECAFNLSIHPDSVTQEQFNQRYLRK